MKCHSCQREWPEGTKFCGNCGHPLQELVPSGPPTQGVLSPPGGVAPPEAVRAPTQRGTLWILLAGAAGLGLAFLVYWLLGGRGIQGLSLPFIGRSSPVLNQFQVAWRQGWLVAPQGQSAYDLYLQLKKDPSVKPEKLRELESQVLPVLENIRQAAFQKWRDESKLDDRFSTWSDFCRFLEWLTTLRAEAAYRAELFYCQGQAAFLESDYDRALEAFQRALELRPGWSLVLNGIGRCYVRQKDWDSAEKYYKLAMAADPSWVYPAMNLGGVYLQTRRYAEAEQAYRKALELAPTKPAIHYYLGEVYYEMVYRGGDRSRRPQMCAAWQKALEYAQGQTDVGFDPEALRGRMRRVKCS